MRGTPPSRRVRYAALALLWPALTWCAPRKSAPETPWQMAEAARQQLLAIPSEQRTENDYRTVMDAYRLIYHGNPADMHAPEAVFEVGLLLADEGNTLHQPKMLQASIGQFEFLRTQYPQSSFRIAALLEEAHVAANDLRDIKLARAKYNEFVEQYPRSMHTAEAQAALQQLRAGKLPQAAMPQTTAEANSARVAAATSSGVPGAAVSPEVHAEASLAASQGSTSQPVAVASPIPQRAASQTSNSERRTAVQDASAQVPAHTANGLATVSGIRHWSTPTYTRVAIDLGDDVQYEAARVPNPDRIYFDLHGTRLAQELAGKAFNVTDDGYLKRIRAAQYSSDISRIVFDVSDVKDYSAFLLPNPYRLIIDIHGTERPAPSSSADANTPATASLNRKQQTTAGSGIVSDAAKAQQPPSTPAKVPQTPAAITPTVPSTAATGHEVASLGNGPDTQHATSQPTSQPIAVSSPVAVNVNVSKRLSKSGATSSPAPGHAASPTTDGQRTLQRALGLKISRIVIDPGHGGHDSGTIGADGIMEKDVVLDVALRLGTLLHDKLGAKIIYTRSDDTFIPLETRTAIANKAEADLFISIHANSSDEESARGVETYYLNFTAQPDALDVAARENAVSDRGVHQLADLVKKITLKDKIDESREFATDVEQSLYDGLRRGNDGLKNRGVKKAPFVVLIGANMPSILTEISFVTNREDASKLRTPEYRERVAASIYRGIATYTSGLSADRVATAAKSTADAQ